MVVFWVCEEFFGSCFFYDLFVCYEDDMVGGFLCEVYFVCDYDYGYVVLGEFDYDVEYFVDYFGV